MKLETKMTVSFAIVAFAVLVISSAPAVAVVLGTAVIGFIGWHVGCALAPDDVVEPTKSEGFTRRPDGTYEFKDTDHRNYEDF